MLWAITDQKLQDELKALALIGIVVTTPYMRLFYSNKARLSNLEMVTTLSLFY